MCWMRAIHGFRFWTCKAAIGGSSICGMRKARAWRPMREAMYSSQVLTMQSRYWTAWGASNRALAGPAKGRERSTGLWALRWMPDNAPTSPTSGIIACKFFRLSAPQRPNRPRMRRPREWHAAHSVIKFSNASAPEWLRNSLWCTSKFDIVCHASGASNSLEEGRVSEFPNIINTNALQLIQMTDFELRQRTFIRLPGTDSCKFYGRSPLVEVSSEKRVLKFAPVRIPKMPV